MTKLRWITSGGGPFVLATRSSAAVWQGIRRPIHKNTTKCATDYERACAIKDYAGKIESSPYPCLIIGDVPDPITWVAINDDEGIIVKCLGADSDEQVQTSLSNLERTLFTELSFNFEIAEPEVFVFDAAWVLEEIGSNKLEFRLKIGEYAASMLNYEPNDRLNLHLLRLSRRVVNGSSRAGV